MKTDRIDFISAYCDGWCERCAFTLRCSAYAVQMATAMCDGDVEAALELAVGRPARVGSSDEGGSMDPPEELPTQTEVAEFERRLEARRDRVDESPLTTLVAIARTLARDWLDAHRAELESIAAPHVAEALHIAGWDCYLIGAKVHRALSGRERARQGEYPDDDPVQNDWNGSAKVALISAERSAAAWRALAAATGEADADHVADLHATLGRAIEQEFPDVRRFVRPGFDEPDR